MRHRRWLIPAFGAALCFVAGVAHSQDEAKGAEVQTKIISGPKDVPAELTRSIVRYLKQNPLKEGHRLKIQIGYYFDQGQTGSSNEYEPFVKSLVPIDEDGKEQGDMYIWGGPRLGLSDKIPYVDGERHGMASRYIGNKLRAKIPWKHGEMVGVKKEFYPEGAVRAEVELKDNEANGTTKTYSPEGELMREGTMKDGKRHGAMTDYWPETGNKRRVVVYDMGEIAEDVVMYHPNGKVARVVPIKDNARHGVGKVCDENGEVLEKTYWLDDEMVSKFQYEQYQRAQEKNGE